MAELTSTLSQLLSGQTSQISQRIGADDAQTSNAIQMAVPSLLAAFSQEANRGGGLKQAVAEDHDADRLLLVEARHHDRDGWSCSRRLRQRRRNRDRWGGHRSTPPITGSSKASQSATALGVVSAVELAGNGDAAGTRNSAATAP